VRPRAVWLTALFCFATPPARADVPGEGPGVYGELDGAWTVGLAGGGGVVAGGSGAAAPSAAGQLDLFFLQTVGLKLGYLTYGKAALGVDQRQHALLVDVDVRPLFLTLFRSDRFTGRPLLDLFLYSIGIEVGFSYERTALRAPSEEATVGGFGFHIGIGFEVPLYRRRGGQGLYLRFQVRGNFRGDVVLPPPFARNAGVGALGIDAVQAGLLLRYRFQLGTSLWPLVR
jgi:hypothetical protein